MDTQVKQNEKVIDGKNYLKMLSDPIRSRIMIETLLRGKITAKDLMEILNINRSAISYHLALMVENNVLDVEINEKGQLPEPSRGV